MKQIELTQGQVTIVDDEDFLYLSQFAWFAMKIGNTFYAGRKTRRAEGKVTTMMMHRLIMEVTDPKLKVDHKDWNGLNNTRDNLRIATNAQNVQNVGINKRNTSGYKGVHWETARRKWVAMLWVDKRKKNLGSFSNIQDAVAAYDNAVRNTRGEFGWTNTK